MTSEHSGLVDDLQSLRRQFEAIRAEAESLLADLNDAQFNWHPHPREWSIAECLDHLIVTGRQSLSFIGSAIREARWRGLLGQGPFRYGWLERWFVRAMDAPPRMKFKAPKAYAPSPDRHRAAVVPDFFALQEAFVECLHEANGIDLAKTKVSNPVSKWLKLSLGQELAFSAAHERQHLWQARRIKEHPNFPQRS
jgi:hypothetical protein